MKKVDKSLRRARNFALYADLIQMYDFES